MEGAGRWGRPVPCADGLGLVPGARSLAVKCRKRIQTQARPAGLREAGSTPWLSASWVLCQGAARPERGCVYAQPSKPYRECGTRRGRRGPAPQLHRSLVNLGSAALLAGDEWLRSSGHHTRPPQPTLPTPPALPARPNSATKGYAGLQFTASLSPGGSSRPWTPGAGPPGSRPSRTPPATASEPLPGLIADLC